MSDICIPYYQSLGCVKKHRVFISNIELIFLKTNLNAVRTLSYQEHDLLYMPLWVQQHVIVVKIG